MIHSIRIQNFKAFEDLTLKNFSRVMLVGGQNNVGKTCLLEAIFMFLDRTSEGAIIGQYGRRGLQAIDPRKETMLAPLFYGFDLGKEITINADFDDGTESLRIHLERDYIPLPSQSAKRKGDDAIRTDQDFGGIDALKFDYGPGGITHLYTDPQRGPVLHIDHLHVRHVKAVFLPSSTKRRAVEESRAYGELDREGNAGHVLDFLKLVEPSVESVSVILIGNEPILHAKLSGHDRKIPISLLGEGMSRAASLGIALVEAGNGLLLIDEIENGLHYSVQAKIWKALDQAARKMNCQVIATTHSYECLRHATEGLAGELAADFSYVRLDRIDGKIVVKHYDYEMLETAIGAGMEVR